MSTSGSSPDLSIIIVNWNSRDFLRKCLISVLEAGSEVSHEIIVVDNASFDGCAEMLEREFRCANFVQSDENLGFGRANNLGFARATGRNLLFLNPDTEVIGTALSTMMSFVDHHQNVGIVGPKLLNSDLTVQIDCVKAFPSLISEILDSNYLKHRFPRFSMWGMLPLFDTSLTPAPVEVVSGASLMIKRDVFERVGGFSSQYFMYSEDVDLCYKVREAGWGVYFVGRAEIVHHGGKSSALSTKSHFAVILTRESRFRFLRTARGTAYAFGFRVVAGANALCRLGLLALSIPFLRKRRGANGRDALGKWVHILRWSVGLERWAETLG